MYKSLTPHPSHPCTPQAYDKQLVPSHHLPTPVPLNTCPPPPPNLSDHTPHPSITPQASNKRLVLGTRTEPPVPSCVACGRAQLTLRANTGGMTLGALLSKVRASLISAISLCYRATSIW
jgi:hypothetical protein